MVINKNIAICALMSVYEVNQTDMLCQSLGSQCVTKGQRTYTGSLKYCV